MLVQVVTGVIEVIPIIKRNTMVSFLLRTFLNSKYYINHSRLKDLEIAELSYPV